MMVKIILFLVVGLRLCVSVESDQHILQELMQMKADMAKLQKSNEIMTEEIRNLKDIVGQTPHTGVPRHKRVAVTYNRVAFSAELGSHLHQIPISKPIVYDSVRLNDGNDYNSTSGIFVAPMTGVYCFYWNLMTDGSSAFDSTLMSSRGRLADGYAHSGSTGGNLILAQLYSGDHVYVEKADTYGNFLHDRFTSFAGFLLYEGEAGPIFG